ncbi:hypothetical protein MTP03_13570 [Tsukamurella sp. PLM1]|nr:hypothetical protein MTP03_13570 [Tsukamurella sp. PLM1]
MPRLEHVQELAAGDLREPDGAHVAGIPPEHPVHLLVHALRLDGDVVEVGAPLHGPLALRAVGDPGAAVGQRARGAPLARDRDQLVQGGPGVGDDAVVGREDPPDLRRVDVDVHELPVAAVRVQAARVAVGPPVADAEHEVRREHGGVAVPVRGLQAHHAGCEAVIVRDGAPAHERGHHRDVQQLSQFHQLRGGVGVDDAAAGHDQGALRGREHVQGLLGLGAGGGRLVDGERGVGVRVELDLGELHVDGQIDEDGTGPTRTHEVEGLGEHARDLGGLEHRDGHLGDGPRDRRDVDGLEVLLVQPRHGRLAGDRQDRDGIGHRRVQPGDHVGSSRAGGADAHADVAGLRAGEALRHVRGALDVAGQHVADSAVRAERGVERVDRGAGHAERLSGAFEFQDLGRRLGGTHASHVSTPVVSVV